MHEMTLEEIHTAELDVLKIVDSVCRKIGVNYWVMFGTLIGAVREHGFIPWDDDLDIAMKREDYDKFIKSFNHNELHLSHVSTDNNYYYYIARVSDTKSFIDFGGGYTSGIFIDIYPMDGLEGAEWPYTKRKKLIRNLLHTFFFSFHVGKYKRKSSDTMTRHIIKKTIRAIVKILPFTMSIINVWRKLGYKLLDKIVRKYDFDKSEYVGIPGWELEVCYRRSCFDETVYMKFEDFKVPVPNGYDEILRQTYGDYMQRPPENERKPHKVYTAYKL
ncbi:MAG: LicD family protein [Synergistaceae bacterium]|nr:LicD family protein [Synergistaceae bacterium]